MFFLLRTPTKYDILYHLGGSDEAEFFKNIGGTSNGSNEMEIDFLCYHSYGVFQYSRFF